VWKLSARYDPRTSVNLEERGALSVEIRCKMVQKVGSNGVSERVRFRENAWFSRRPPFPHRLKALDWRALCKNAPQNLEP